jgi:hypothetical protein
LDADARERFLMSNVDALSVDFSTASGPASFRRPIARNAKPLESRREPKEGSRGSRRRRERKREQLVARLVESLNSGTRCLSAASAITANSLWAFIERINEAVLSKQ